MLVCDGVSEGSFSNAEVCKLAAQVMHETGGDAAKAAEAVCFKAVERESKDNISCMIVLLGGVDASAGKAIGMGSQRESRIDYSASAGTPRAITMGKQVELQPGSLVGSDNSAFVKAYIAMCDRGGMSFAEAVEKRHALLAARRGSAAAQEDDEAELSLIGTPQGAPGSPQRKAWFEEWAREREEQRNGPGGDDDDGGGPGGGSVEQLMAMKMLLEMMRSQGGRPGP